jgi:hypothetical protein
VKNRPGVKKRAVAVIRHGGESKKSGDFDMLEKPIERRSTKPAPTESRVNQPGFAVFGAPPECPVLAVSHFWST